LTPAAVRGNLYTMTELPRGTLTFLFTDIEGSTRLWEADHEAMAQALARHDSLLRDVLERSGGRVFKSTGDGFCAVFAVAAQAAQAALAAQRALHHGVSAHPPPALRVRMALHSGQAELRDGDYFGATLSRVARLVEASHGGQILLSGATQDAVRDTLPAGVALKALGVHHLRDLQEPERIFQMLHPELPGDFAPLRTVNAVWIAHHGFASKTMAPPWLRLPAAQTTTTPRRSRHEVDSRTRAGGQLVLPIGENENSLPGS
jgi:class 3 adenylate cyclase